MGLLDEFQAVEHGKTAPEKAKDPGFQETSTQARGREFKPVSFKTEKDAEKDFIEFVGFRGYYDEKGYPVVDCHHEVTVKEVKDEDTGKVMEIVHEYVFDHPYNRGKAHPPPIDEKDVKWGILPHEVEAFHLIRRYLDTGIMFKWPRGFGKTYVACWFIEWSMKRLGYPWLYLSETAIMNDVAFWIWQWAKKSNLIVSSQRGDKQNTYTQFELKNGAVLRIYSYMEEKSVGQHGWYIAFDDIIKKKWSERPSDVKKAKNQWNYSLRYIRRKGLMCFGTRKFIGDPLEHLETMIPELHVEVRTPYIMEGEFPTWTPKMDASTGEEVLWVPELYTLEDLENKKVVPTEDGEDPLLAWQSEMMQDPRPTAGKRWEEVKYVKQLEHMNNYDLCFIYLDRATTLKETSDYTGFIQGVREMGTGIRYVMNDFTGKIPLEHLLFDISEFVDLWHRKYEHMAFVLIVEKQGGGDDFLTAARLRNDFEKEGKKIHNYIRDSCSLEETQTRGEKKKRIQDRLGAAIEHGQVKFMNTLKNSEVIKEILTFPYCNKFDALDALSFDFLLMDLYPITGTKANVEEIMTVYREVEREEKERKRSRDRGSVKDEGDMEGYFKKELRW